MSFHIYSDDVRGIKSEVYRSNLVAHVCEEKV